MQHRQRNIIEDNHYQTFKELARQHIVNRVMHYAGLMGAPVSRVAIRNQRRRWGSCSSKGNLNFNYKLYFVGPELLDYVVVHELCHLREFNHGPKFWQAVAFVVPEYQACIDKLRRLELETRMCPLALKSRATHLTEKVINMELKTIKRPAPTKRKTRKKQIYPGTLIHAILRRLSL